jgi:hypothetical protein
MKKFIMASSCIKLENSTTNFFFYQVLKEILCIFGAYLKWAIIFEVFG